MLSCCALPLIHTVTIQLLKGWAEGETKWFKGMQEIWRRRGVEAVPYPVELTIAGGGGGKKSPAWATEKRRRRRVSRAVARVSPGFQAFKEQIAACGYKGLVWRVSGIVATSKRKYLGTFGDVHAAARACNEFSGAEPGDSNYNAVEQQMDADGAPVEYSRCT
jgi:hypothetical protein